MEFLAADIGSFVPPLLIVVGLLGIALPVLPGLLLVLAGVLLWAVMEGTGLAWGIFAAGVAVAVAGFALQYLLPGRRMRERGVQTSTLGIAMLFGLVGFFVVPVVGAPLFFVAGIYLVELSRYRDGQRAWAATRSALKGVLRSMGVELSAAMLIAITWGVGIVSHSV